MTDSGPFCRHFGDLDCDKRCDACGHTCSRHGDECNHIDCACSGYVDVELVKAREGWDCRTDDDGWRHAELPGSLTGGMWSFHPEHGMRAGGPEDRDGDAPDCPPLVVRWLTGERDERTVRLKPLVD